MAVGSTWKRGDGVTTSHSAASGKCTDVLYSWIVSWKLGGEGEASSSDQVQPKRPLPDDSQIAAAAPDGSPCTVTISPTGKLTLYVQDEDWGFTDCIP